jgi:hypothetical protein
MSNQLGWSRCYLSIYLSIYYEAHAAKHHSGDAIVFQHGWYVYMDSLIYLPLGTGCVKHGPAICSGLEQGLALSNRGHVTEAVFDDLEASRVWL